MYMLQLYLYIEQRIICKKSFFTINVKEREKEVTVIKIANSIF